MEVQKDTIIVLSFWVIYGPFSIIAWHMVYQSYLLLFALLLMGMTLTAIYLFIRLLISSFKRKRKKKIPEEVKEEVQEDLGLDEVEPGLDEVKLDETEPEEEPKEKQDWNPVLIENFENIFKPDFGVIDLD